MSLELAQSNGITVKTGLPCSCHGRGLVNIYRSQYAATKKDPAFDICVTMHDFVGMVQYVLENTVLEDRNDPRVALLEYIHAMEVRRIPREGLRIVPKRSLGYR